MIKSVSIIGSGNVATILAKAISKTNISILNICSRSMVNAKALASLVNAKPIDDVINLDIDTDLIIVSINDDSIAGLIANIRLDIPIVHTSGSVSIDVLSKFSNYGSIYPFQTFSKSRDITISEVPFLIEANSPRFESDIKLFLSENISNKIYKSDSFKRSKIHLAGVLSSNFTIQLLAEAKKILGTVDMPFELLESLVKESIGKAFDMGPNEALTGPAKRGDEQTIQKQLDLLSETDLKSVYQLITNLITKG